MIRVEIKFAQNHFKNILHETLRTDSNCYDYNYNQNVSSEYLKTNKCRMIKLKCI